MTVHASIDVAMANHHLALLGIRDTDPVILCAYGEAVLRTPERQGLSYDWPAVMEVAR